MKLTKLQFEKIKLDPFYYPLYEKYGLEFILGAGFIFDNAPYPMTITDDFDCTPVSFLLEKLKTAKNPAIIYTTGSFCPLHDGHLEMVDKARLAVEAKGYDVIGGYIAPDNDEYVSRKANVLNIHERLKIISRKIKDIDWLAVDPWNGVFRNYAENFTSLIVHLQMYLKRHLGIDIPIFYVCGGDNAKFCLTFIDKGHCVVVDRPGSQTYDNYSNIFNERILYAFNDNSNSSTEVRKTFKKDEHKRKRLLLRVDEYDEREEAVINELSKHFEEIKISRISEETEVFNAIQSPIISLDSILKSKHNISVSRQYDYYGQKFLGWTNRPGSLPIDEQFELLKGNTENFFLFDDDIHTGRTIEYLRERLKDLVKIVGQISLTTSNDTEEVLDCRDFYYAKENCGLVVLNSSGLKERYIYAYPFVCPYQRASIMNPLKFSIAIWEINYSYFLKTRDKKHLNDCKTILESLKKIK